MTAPVITRPDDIRVTEPELMSERAAQPAAPPQHAQASEPGRARADTLATAGADQFPVRSAGTGRVIASWPLLILGLPAAVTIWSGWVGIGQMTGFGLVHPLPGIWDSLRVNTAVTLPVGVEAYAAYALRAWLSASTVISPRTRRFARRSAIASLLLGMAGQAGYHLLAQVGATRAPWLITTAVSCLPVLVLGMGAALAHLLRDDTRSTAAAGPAAPQSAGQAHHHDHACRDRATEIAGGERLARAQAAARRLAAAGQSVSRRSLRAAGVRGSNASLGALARALGTSPWQAPTPSTVPD